MEFLVISGLLEKISDNLEYDRNLEFFESVKRIRQSSKSCGILAPFLPKKNLVNLTRGPRTLFESFFKETPVLVRETVKKSIIKHPTTYLPYC